MFSNAEEEDGADSTYIAASSVFYDSGCDNSSHRKSKHTVPANWDGNASAPYTHVTTNDDDSTREYDIIPMATNDDDVDDHNNNNR